MRRACSARASPPRRRLMKKRRPSCTPKLGNWLWNVIFCAMPRAFCTCATASLHERVARETRQKMVSKGHKLSIRSPCKLLDLRRSSIYYTPLGESAENLRFMEIIDKQFLETPWYGSRQMARFMKRNGHQCGRHRVRRLMRLMRLVPIY